MMHEIGDGHNSRSRSVFVPLRVELLALIYPKINETFRSNPLTKFLIRKMRTLIFYEKLSEIEIS